MKTKQFYSYQEFIKPRLLLKIIILNYILDVSKTAIIGEMSLNVSLLQVACLQIILQEISLPVIFI